MRTPALVGGALVATLALGVAPAGADRNPYGPRQVCGSSEFRIIDRQDIRTPTRKLGTTYLLYRPSTGWNCVVTLKTYAVGRPSWVAASIEKQGGRGPRRDSGQFRYYAGPRKVHAPGTCVRWGGGITHGTQSAGFATDWEHCR